MKAPAPLARGPRVWARVESGSHTAGVGVRHTPAAVVRLLAT